VGEVALSYAEVKALATGNPLILEKAGVDNEIARLMRLRQAHCRDRAMLRRGVEAARLVIPAVERSYRSAEAAIARRVDTAGEQFRMVVGGVEHRRRADAGAQLLSILIRELEVPEGNSAEPRSTGRLGGFEVEIKALGVPGVETRVMIGLSDTPLERLYVTAGDLAGLDPAGVVMRLENKIRSLEHVREATVEALARVRKEMAAAESRIGLPFDQKERLTTLRRRQAEIEAALIPAESQAGQLADPGGGPAVQPDDAPTPARERGAQSAGRASWNGLPPSPIRGVPVAFPPGLDRGGPGFSR